MVHKTLLHLFKALVIVSFTTVTSTYANIDLKKQLTEVLPIDPNLRIGTLDNGLRYYIRKNARPKNQAVLNLYVNAGSINEQEHEQGIAHFVEHLQYKGSENFRDEKEFENYFNSNGILSSADKNAYTSFDVTSYFFVIPTTDQSLVQRTMLTLSDFGGRALLRQEAIDTERSVVLDEKQLRNSAQLREMYATFSTLLADSDYPNRFPIGTTQVISHASQKTLRDFYEAWYVPTNMALIAVGDFDPETIETYVKEAFSSLVNKPTPSTANLHNKPEPKYGEPVFFVDQEKTSSELTIYFNIDKIKPNSVKDLRTLVIENLASIILNQRMITARYISDAGAKNLNFYIARNSLRNFDFALATCSFKQNQATQATQELGYLIKQFSDHGISQSELAWAKKSYESNSTQIITNANTLPHNVFQTNYNAHFISNNHLNIASLPELAQLEIDLLATISQDDVQAIAQNLFDFNKSIAIFSFNTESYDEIGGTQGEAALYQILTDTSSAASTAYEDAMHGEISKLEGTSSGEQSVIDIDAIDAKKIVLGNGITVYYKQTNFTENIIDITGFAVGGLDAVQSNPIPASISSVAVTNIGFGGMKPYEWASVLNDKPNFYVYNFIGLHGRGLSASCSKEDLPLCFTVMLTNLLQPNKDQDLFTLFKQNTQQALVEKQKNPVHLFMESNTEIIDAHPTLFHPLSEKQLEEISLDDILETYQKAFNNVSEFTFSISGNITTEELLPILNSTLGTLPESQKSLWQALPIELGFPQGQSRRTFDKTSQQQTVTIVSLPFSMTISLENERLLDLYKNIVQMRITEALRFDAGKTYTQQVHTSTQNNLFVGYNDTTGRLQFFCSCNKDDIDATTTIIINVLTAIQIDGFNAEELGQSKKIMQNNIIQSFKNNHSWNSFIIDRHVRMNGQYESVEKQCAQVEQVTLDALNAFTQKLVTTDNYFAYSVIAEN